MDVPKIRFKEFSDKWEKVNLKSVFSYYSTNSLSREQLSDNGIIKNIHYGDIHRKFSTIVDVKNDVDTYIKDCAYYNKNELCKNGDLIFADASEDYDGIGKAIELNNIDCDTVSGLHTIMVRDNDNIFAPKYKGFYFNSPVIHNQLKVFANGFKVYGISKDSINKLDAKIPSIKEQEKIANLLDLLDGKIKLQTKKIKDLAILKKGLLKSEYKKISNTNLIKLGEIAKIYQPQTLAQNQLDNGDYPVYGANGIIGYNSVFNHEYSQVTISCRGENSGVVNRTQDKCWINGNSMVINIDDSNVILKDYLQVILESQNLKYMVSGSGQPQIIRSAVEKHKIPLINLQEQEKYYEKFILLDKKIKLELKKRGSLLELKKGLMQNMFV